MKKTAILLCCSFIWIACSKDGHTGLPYCINRAIRQLQQNNNCRPGGSFVKEYSFQQQTVYEVTDCDETADGTRTIISGHCEVLGYLGGIAGNGRINGESFDKAVYIRTVWSN